MRYGMSRFAFCFVLIAGGLWQAASASAQTEKQLSLCDDPNATDDQTISGCTAAIQSGRYSGRILAIKFYNRGCAYDNKDQYDRSIQDYDQAIKLDPNYTKAFFNRGFAYHHKGQFDRAIQDDDQAIKLNPNDAETFDNRGIAYAAKGQYDRAIQDYDQAIKLNPNDAKAFYGRSLAKEKKGDKAGAEVDLATARRIDPNVDK